MDVIQILVFFSIVVRGYGNLKPCIKKYIDEENFNCVCNSTYCDSVESFVDLDLKKGSYVHYESSLDGKRLHLSKGKFSRKVQATNFWEETISHLVASFTVKTSPVYQEVYGFGGALTDSTALVLSNLTEETQNQLLRQYFSPECMNYTFLRIPVGGTDFSIHKYTYDDEGVGLSLSHFNLTVEDYKYKIPIIKKIQQMTSSSIKILATPWTPPDRMKEFRYSPLIEKVVKLKEEYYPVYAEYIIKSLDFYKKEGIEIWGLSPANEPFIGLIGYLYPVNLSWTPWEQAKWIAENLGPLLHSRGYADIKLMVYDDQRFFIYLWTSIIMERRDARKYISGVAFHWYADFAIPGSFISKTHRAFPELFIISTEASITPFVHNAAIYKAKWYTLEWYVNSIVDDMNHWVNGWIDWNIALDDDGGPDLNGLRLIPCIMVNRTTDEFYKLPLWYGVAHFSYFVPPGSRRIELEEWFTYGISSAAFLTPENRVIIVLMNKIDLFRDVVINVGEEEQIKVRLDRKSVHTFIYKMH